MPKKKSVKKKKVSSKKRLPKEKIIVFGAHSDDFVLGAGGTHPWLKEKEVQKMREKEAHSASKVLGCKTIFFDLKEGKFMEGAMQKDLVKELFKIVKRVKPTKIFTHSSEDPHPDHKNVNELTLQVYDQLEKELKPEVYVYSVWNPVEFKTKFPSLLVDISKTFSLKVKSFNKFKSQKVHTIYPLFLMYFKALKEGIKIRKRFGEKFFRIR